MKKERRVRFEVDVDVSSRNTNVSEFPTIYRPGDIDDNGGGVRQ